MGNNNSSNNKNNSSNNKNSKIVPTVERMFMLGIIDPQNDFFSGGSLPVKNAEDVIGPINKLRFLCYDHMYTFISQDYHPNNHMSFASTHNEKPFVEKTLTLNLKQTNGVENEIVVKQTLWPSHCIQGTKGTEFHKDFLLLKSDKIFRKGTMENVESYSAFGDQFYGKYECTSLDKWLKSKNVTDIVIVGIATDFCVYNTILDAQTFGFKVHLILSCTRGVNEENTKQALEHLKTLTEVFIYDDVEDFYDLNKKYFVQI